MINAGRLNSRIDVYKATIGTNELGEKDCVYTKLKSVWAEIYPINGSTQNGEGNTIYVESSHKITIRNNAVSDLTNDMYFMFKGQKYEIVYFNPNYKNRDSVEIMSRLVIE